MSHSNGRWSIRGEHVTFLVASAVVAACLFAPRPLNFAPLGAFGLFAGAYAKSCWSWVYPLTAVAIYVVGTGGYSGFILATVFLAFAGPALLGRFALKDRVRPLRVGASAIGSSLISSSRRRCSEATRWRSWPWGAWAPRLNERKRALPRGFVLGVTNTRRPQGKAIVSSAPFSIGSVPVSCQSTIDAGINPASSTSAKKSRRGSSGSCPVRSARSSSIRYLPVM